VEYRSIADLSRLVAARAPEVAGQVDLVVGVPRSGLLPATMLALHLNLPMTDVEGLVAGRVLASGRRGPANPLDRGESLRVLVVDDSVQSGTQMRETRARLEEARLPHEYTYAAAYASRRGSEHVDLYFEMVSDRRAFEWNLFHHGYYLERACVDIDGVLCPDPTEDENDDGPRYEHFVATAPLLHLPTKPIGWLVTSRLEKYRALTEAWLDDQGIDYGQLVMMDYPDKAARVAAGNHGAFKASVYESTSAELFIESASWQAEEIARTTGKPVFCVETGSMLQGLSAPTGSPDSAAYRAYRWARSKARPVRKWLLRRFSQSGSSTRGPGGSAPRVST
jgi:orotate phosphoribosyltransferase